MAGTGTTPTERRRRMTVARRRGFWATFLLGAATMAGVDEIVFHQLLRWHHFYDGATTDVGLVSDGVLHALELVALIAGFFLLSDARRRGPVDAMTGWAGFVLGAGAFQVWDGLIDHKVLRVHQVRYDVALLPYDVAWVAAGVVLLVLGILLRLRADGEQAP